MPAAVDGEAERGAVRGVPEDVAHQRVHRGGQLGLGDGHGSGRVGADQVPSAVLVLGQRRPERHPPAHHLRRVAARRARGRARARDGPGGPPRRGDDLVDRPLQPVQRAAALRQPGRVAGVGRQPVQVDPQGRQRGAQPVRQVGARLPLGRQQPGEPVGHVVERLARRAQLRRPLRVDARRQVARRDPGHRAHQPLGGPHHARGEPVGHRHRDQHQRQRHQGEDQPGPGDAATQLLLRDVHLDDRVGPGLQQDGAQQHLPARRLDRGGAAVPPRRGEVAGRRVGRPEDLARGQVQREPPRRPGGHRADRVVQRGRVAGHRQHRHERGRLPLGRRHRPVVRRPAVQQPQRDDEGQRHHRRHRRRDARQRSSHPARLPSGTTAPSGDYGEPAVQGAKVMFL